MSNSPHGAELEEEEEFYESLDRVLSSSCSSTSASDNEGDYCHQNHHRRRSGFLHPSTISLDVWLSDPGSVEERRRRLLQQIGLAGEPALTWVKPYGGGGCVGEMGRSVSCHGLCCGARDCPSAGAFARSRSDGSVETVPVHKQQPPGAGKPPLVGKSTSTVGGEVRMLHGYGGADREDAKRCTIKNLDNGKEFVVKEFREDGMWNKLGEVGTGRQLTMEEFEICVGSSPIVQELMRRQNVETGPGNRSKDGSGSSGGGRSKRSSSWFRSFKNVMAGGQQRERPSSDEKESSSEKGGRRSSSATDESQDSPQSLHCGPERMKVRHYGKYHKELTGLYLSQEIQAHNGSIWTIKFSLDGHYVASAGEDLVIHVWQVLDHERRTELHMYRPEPEIGSGNPLVALVGNGSAEHISALECMDDSHWEKKRRTKASGMRSSDNLTVPEQVFTLSERPVCTFAGHLDEVLDLSWSESQYLLSSSMDKTVRLWHFSSNSCLKIFSHSDYVTCIQFNPIDDRYFISGSLDAKVRVWSIPNRQVVDWNDLHEMVTAACYTPDGQGAVVGSHKGNCHLYDTSDNKLLHKGQIDLQNKKKKSNHRKITGFQFAPGSSSEVVVTSADSRIRVINGCNVIHKFKGFRNTSSQISACLTANGKYVISASEDSYVYVWKYDADMRPCGSKSVVSVTRSYEHFRCPNVTAAVPWPGFGSNLGEMFAPDSGKENGPHALLSPAEMSSDSGTWPHEKLPSPSSKHSRRSSRDLTCGTSPAQSRSAWGMVIVTSSRGGEIRIYQNFGLPVGV